MHFYDQNEQRTKRQKYLRYETVQVGEIFKEFFQRGISIEWRFNWQVTREAEVYKGMIRRSAFNALFTNVNKLGICLTCL